MEIKSFKKVKCFLAMSGFILIFPEFRFADKQYLLRHQTRSESMPQLLIIRFLYEDEDGKQVKLTIAAFKMPYIICFYI
jgi:hypothetical protein